MDIFSFLFSFINIEKLLLYLLYAILGGIGTFVGWFVFAYNSLIKARRGVDEARANINAFLKRRIDLLPNLVEIVKGYAAHERETLEKVTNARGAAMGAKTAAEQIQAENMLTQALKSIFAVAENYPDLKASTNFLQLQNELSNIEGELQNARRIYNGMVQDFNVKIESIPTNFVAKFFRFHQADFLEIAENEKEVPKIKF